MTDNSPMIPMINAGDKIQLFLGRFLPTIISRKPSIYKGLWALPTPGLWNKMEGQRHKIKNTTSKKKYKLNVNSTLIFLIILFQFQVFSILSSIFSHVHSAIRNCNDYESLLYYKMFLYTQIQVCTHAYNP